MPFLWTPIPEPMRRIVLPALALLSGLLQAQAPLNTFDVPVVIDFTNSVPGVNNGLFDAQAPIGSTSPGPGQLDFNGWNWVNDAAPSAAAQGPANFPGALPNGNGVGTAGSLVGGISAVDINGTRALAVQPTTGVWTSGNLTLRAVNNTGGALEQLAVDYTLFVYNDQARSSDVRFYYSLTAAQDSWVEVLTAAVTSAVDPDATPAWVASTISTTLSGFSMNPGDVIYLRWVGNDVGGSGTRDEFALGNIILTPEAATGPNVVTSITGLPPFSQLVGTPSAAQSFIAFGSLLVGDVSIAAPAPFQISLSEASGYTTNLTLPQTGGIAGPANIYVRMNSATPGPFNGLITLSSPGAGGALVSVAGIANPATVPPITINELMPLNSSYIADPNGEFNDWFELYNPTNAAVDLGGWFVSDDPADLVKFQLTPGSPQVQISAEGFLLMWADDQVNQGDLHTNFTLNDAGGTLLLVAPDGTTIVDQLTYGTLAPNTSYGRELDGGTPLVVFTVPTPGSTNETSSITEMRTVPALRAWPVPVTGGELRFDRVVSGEVFAADGRQVLRAQRTAVLDVAALQPGTYTLRCIDGARVVFVK